MLTRAALRYARISTTIAVEVAGLAGAGAEGGVLRAKVIAVAAALRLGARVVLTVDIAQEIRFAPIMEIIVWTVRMSGCALTVAAPVAPAFCARKITAACPWRPIVIVEIVITAI